MATQKQQMLSLFTAGQSGLVQKMDRFYGGQLSLERALMHYGISPNNPDDYANRLLKQWARKHPLLRVQRCKVFRNAKDVPGYKLVLNQPSEKAIASQEVAS